MPTNPKNTTKSTLKSVVFTALKILFAVGLIAWMVKRGGLDPNALKIALEPTAFIIFLLLAFLQVLMANARWLVLLKGQGFKASTRQTLPLTLMGIFFNYAMPGSVGGDIIKGYYITQDFPEKKLAAGVSVFMDRLIGFFIMILSGAIVVLAFRDQLEHDSRLMVIANGTLLVTFCFSLVLCVSLSRRLQSPIRFFSKYISRLPGHKQIQQIYFAMHSYRYRTRELFFALAFSAINQGLLIAFFYFAAKLLGEGDIPVATFWFCIPVGLVAMAVPISPAGVGVGQAVFFFLFQATLGHPTQVGSVGITLLQLFQFLMGLVGAFFYLKRGKKMPATEVLEQGERALVDASAD